MVRDNGRPNKEGDLIMKQFSAAGLLLMSLILVGCSNQDTLSKPANVFGGDNREEISTDQYPWRTIGRLRSSTGGICTATLIAKNLIVAAAHCIMDPSTHELQNGGGFVFQPNYKNGYSGADVDIEWYWWGTTTPSESRRSDWAIMRTATAVGDEFGWLGVKYTTVSDFPSQLSVAGYSNDFQNGETAGIHHNCDTKKQDEVNGIILHDCDTARGSSGGPALRMYDGNLTIVGLNVAERRNGGQSTLNRDRYEERHANIAIPTSAMLAKLHEILDAE